MTNFVGNHDAEQESSVLVDAGGLLRVAGRSDVSQTHQIAIDLLRANVVPAGVHRVTDAGLLVCERLPVERVGKLPCN